MTFLLTSPAISESRPVASSRLADRVDDRETVPSHERVNSLHGLAGACAARDAAPAATRTGRLGSPAHTRRGPYHHAARTARRSADLCDSDQPAGRRGGKLPAGGHAGGADR